MKRVLRNIIVPILLGILVFIPITRYTLSKTIWKDKDCMIEYVNKYFPRGDIYYIGWEGGGAIHIDKKGLNQLNMDKIGEMRGCTATNTYASWISNTPYCTWTYIFEKI